MKLGGIEKLSRSNEHRAWKCDSADFLSIRYAHLSNLCSKSLVVKLSFAMLTISQSSSALPPQKSYRMVIVDSEVLLHVPSQFLQLIGDVPQNPEFCRLTNVPFFSSFTPGSPASKSSCFRYVVEPSMQSALIQTPRMSLSRSKANAFSGSAPNTSKTNDAVFRGCISRGMCKA